MPVAPSNDCDCVEGIELNEELALLAPALPLPKMLGIVPALKMFGYCRVWEFELKEPLGVVDW